MKSAVLFLCLLTAALHAGSPRILLREALQHQNIGDSGRVPGTLKVLYEAMPDADITLWPWQQHEAEMAMFRRHFPKLRIVAGEVDKDEKPTTGDLASAWKTAEIFITPSKGAGNYKSWAKSGKPFGIFGTTFDAVSDRKTRVEGDTLESLHAIIPALPQGHFDGYFGSRELYERAAFIFCRDHLSLGYVRQQQVKPPVLDFGPDGAFACTVRDEARATRWLKRVGAEDGKFICVLSRLRYTPYYQVRDLAREESDYDLDAINARHAAADHSALRELIVRCVRESDMKVLLCPEMTYQIAVCKAQLYDPLPDDVKPRVVWRDAFWLADEACAVYARAVAIVSAECHSPIMALANGTPGIYVRNPTDGVKGQMFRDIDLGDWVCESGEITGGQLWAKVRAIHADRAATKTRIAAAMQKVAEAQRRMAQAVARAATSGAAKSHD